MFWAQIWEHELLPIKGLSLLAISTDVSDAMSMIMQVPWILCDQIVFAGRMDQNSKK